MPKTIKNMNQLQKALIPAMTGMVDVMAERVYQTLNYFLDEYYNGWTPDSYQRTFAFLHSAVKVDAKPYGNSVRASVYIDYNAMDDYVNATGFEVAEWANTGLHGGLEVNHKPHVWKDAMDETIDNGSLLEMAVQYWIWIRIFFSKAIRFTDLKRLFWFHMRSTRCLSMGKKTGVICRWEYILIRRKINTARK